MEVRKGLAISHLASSCSCCFSKHHKQSNSSVLGKVTQCPSLSVRLEALVLVGKGPRASTFRVEGRSNDCCDADCPVI